MVEILIAVAIVGVLVVSVYGSLAVVARSSLALHGQIDARMDAWIAVEQICTSIRSARRLQIDGPQLELVTSSPILSKGPVGLYRILVRLDSRNHGLLVAEHPVAGMRDERWHPLLGHVESVDWMDESAGRGLEGLVRIRIALEDLPGRSYRIERTIKTCCQVGYDRQKAD